MKLALAVALLATIMTAMAGGVQESFESADALVSETPTQGDLALDAPALDALGLVVGAATETTPEIRAGGPRASATTPSTIAVSGSHSLQVSTELLVPTSVRIPALGLDSAILSVGVDDAGDFDVPRADVGWYRYGVSPGEQGSAVIAAHVDQEGIPGAFFSLSRLLDGDLIEVGMANGEVFTFEVFDQILLDKVTLPGEELFRRDGPSVLRLITCGGTFDAATRSYSGNRVVSARPVA